MAALQGSIQNLIKTTAELAAAPYDTYQVKSGQLVFEVTTGGEVFVKVGNGTDIYADLPYLHVSQEVVDALNIIFKDNVAIEYSFSYSGSGLTYNAYGKGFIQRELYESGIDTITFDNGGAQDRLDAVVLTTSNTVVIRKGTESTNPALPYINPQTDVLLTFLYIPAGATTPTDPVTTETIYEEGVEWTFSSSDASVVRSSSSPITGTESILATNMPSNAYFELAKGSSYDLGDADNLLLDIVVTSAWGNNRALIGTWYSGGSPVGSSWTIINNYLGFDASDLTTQSLAIPIPDDVDVDTLRIARGGGGTINFKIDNIRLQGGAGTGVDLSGYVLKTELADLMADRINNATAKATPVDADLFAIIDSAASNVLKKITWANIKATLKTYFDTLYESKVSVKFYIDFESVETFTFKAPYAMQVDSVTDETGTTSTITGYTVGNALAIYDTFDIDVDVAGMVTLNCTRL